MTRRHMGIIALMCIVATVVLWQSTGATGKGGDSGTQWEYAQLHVQGSKIVFCQGAQESVVTPPTERLPSRKIGDGSNTSRYVVNTTAKRNHTMAALDLFGREGWEAVSTTSTGTKTVVLMKRPK